MVIEISKNALDSADVKSINFLFQIITYKLRYDLFIEVNDVRQLDFFQRLDHDDALLVEESYNKVILEGLEPKFIVSEQDFGPKYLRIDEAIRYLLQPVSIILENSLNDQFFLKAVVDNFDVKGKIASHLSNGWIQFENAGGCTNVENFIEGKLQSFNAYIDKEKFVRALVILDSDKKFPTDGIPEKYLRLVDYLNQIRIEYHILRKRTMQNYLPDQVIDVIGANAAYKPWCDAYSYLTSVQKDYLDYKGGFSAKDEHGTAKVSRSDLHEEVKSLYANVSNANYNVLDKGLNIPSFKSSFPKYFEHHQVHRESLKARIENSDEFEVVLTLIEALI